jgi:hypothetical protein
MLLRDERFVSEGPALLFSHAGVAGWREVCAVGVSYHEIFPFIDTRPLRIVGPLFGFYSRQKEGSQ